MDSLLRQFILEAIAEGPTQTVVVKQADLAGLLKESNQEIYSPLGVNTFCPYSHSGRFVGQGGKFKDLIDNYDLSVFEVVNTIKKDVIKKGKDGTTLVLTMNETDRQHYWSEMAIRIARHFSKQRVDAVTYAASRSDMAGALATLVADKLKVPLVQDILRKVTKEENVSIDEEGFDAWKQGKDPEKVQDLRNALERDIRHIKSKIGDKKKVSVVQDIPGSRRKFINGIHELVTDSLAGLDDGSTVLIVDDNLDTGATFRDIGKLFEKAKQLGITPVFAAGFKINRPSTEEVTGGKITPDVQKELDRQGRYASAMQTGKGGMEYNPTVPTDYKVGDLVQHKKFGLGVIEKVDPAQRKVVVNFENEEKVMGYTPASPGTATASPLLRPPARPKPSFEESILRRLLRLIKS